MFVRRLDRHVGGHTREELKEEIESNHEWVRDVTVVKIKDYTHVMKLEFQTVEEADRIFEKGPMLFHMYVTADQITREEFYNVQACFKCYKYESHTTRDCRETITRCSECAEEGHRWTSSKRGSSICLPSRRQN